MTHEFGHWLQLLDQKSSSCYNATMYFASHGTHNLDRATLTSWDVNGISWQYPP
jgi:hypothetical protein